LLTDPTPSEIYTLSLHDALPICPVPEELGPDEPDDLVRIPEAVRRAVDRHESAAPRHVVEQGPLGPGVDPIDVGVEQERLVSRQDRKSTRLNSSHLVISYAVFCL